MIKLFSVAYLFTLNCVQSLPALPNYDIWGDLNSGTTDGRRKGICLNTYECRIQGGKSYGSCAFGFGVCCVFTASCNKEVFNNITYFVNPDFPSLSRDMKKCTLKVKKIDPEISQFRLDFLHFHLGQPNRRTGVCDDDIFVMSGGNTRELRLCGLNSGQHVYFDVENVKGPVSISMKLKKRSVSRLWEVRVTQIPFSQRAPSGCLQYHTGKTGVLQTMNFAENGRHLANQDYMICMRQEKGMCSIAYEPCDENSFKIGAGNGGSNNGSTGTGGGVGSMGGTMGSPGMPSIMDTMQQIMSGMQPGMNPEMVEEFGSGDGSVESRSDRCSDRIIMPCDSEDVIMPGSSGPAMCDLVHCGTSFCPDGKPTCRVESSVTPFVIGVQFGPGGRDESPDDNLGMCLRFEQQPCAV
ncbi:uncharacterized protein CBL_09392 [Carabus blaptoides fortunei]